MSDDNGLELGIGVAAVIETGDDLAKAVAAPQSPRVPCRVRRELGPLNTDSFGFAVLGAPSIGRLWEVRLVTVMQTDPWTQGATGALSAVCVGNPQPAAGLPVGDVRVPGALIPESSSWLADQLIVQAGQSLYVVVHGGSGSYIVRASVSEVTVEQP